MKNNDSVNILLVDDEMPALEMLKDTVVSVAPKAMVFAVDNYLDALDMVRETVFSIAILDIEMPGITGVELAKLLKDIHPQINIIFLTAYDSYAFEATQLFSSGYLLKPVSKEKLKEQFCNLRYPMTAIDRKLKVRCFGNFDVYNGGEPVLFERSKGKELFAYLVDRRGARATVGEIAAVLYEDDSDEQKNRQNLYSAWHALKRALNAIDFNDVLVHSQNAYSINTSRLDCDYYRYLDGDESAKDTYRGQYMCQYSWAEYSFSQIE